MTAKSNYYSYCECQKVVKLLGILNSKDYLMRYKADPRLPSMPSRIYAGAGWVDFPTFLDHQGFYPTFAEAKAVVQRLGCKTIFEYQRGYKKDPRLPSSPQRTYADSGWSTWPVFLGGEMIDLYENYEEAKAVVRKLSIKSSSDYIARYHHDPSLPARPNKFYASAGWITWASFLDVKKKGCYSTYTEAKSAARSLGVQSAAKYKLRYRQDPRLPHSPDKKYANDGWENWIDFLEVRKYRTYAEAQATVQALGIKNLYDYKVRYSLDPRLPSKPVFQYAKVGWVSWANFLGFEIYESYMDAQAATQALGIKTVFEYQARYFQDPRLTFNPQRIFSDSGWKGWYEYLGTKTSYYLTFEEARAAILKLGAKSRSEYLATYQKDKKLPYDPRKVYLDWPGWPAFLGKAQIYSTYLEAKIAAKSLGIKSGPDYRARYQQDPKLPAHPQVVYVRAGWLGWYDFLGKKKPQHYSTYAEAKSAVHRLAFTSSIDYKQRYSEDKKLPSNPNIVYAEIGWVGWPKFIGVEVRGVYVEYSKIWADVKRWLASQTGIASKKLALKSFLSDYYSELSLPDCSKYLLLRSTGFNSGFYEKFIEAQTVCQQKPYHSAIAMFFQWLLDEDCTDVDGDERVVLPDFRNPFVTVLAGFSNSLDSYRPTQTTKPPLGYEFILRARNALVPNGELVLQTRPDLKDLPHLQYFFNSRFDWVDVEKSSIDFEDPNCVWRVEQSTERRINGKRKLSKIYQVWSPARFVALYTLLRFPLRGQQILWLDSGEADSEIAVLDDKTGRIRWEKNYSHLAGRITSSRPLGAVQRGGNDEAKIYITTNKTGRAEGGYEVEWIPDDLAYWFIILREWQSKFNPLAEPTAWTDINLRAETNEKILKARGAQCFLFRTNSSGQPLFTTTAFSHTLPALLYQIQREGEKLAFKEAGIRQGSQRFVSPYTPHSLRVSLITAFVTEGGASIHIVSKLVGHSSLVMTIYYTKLNGNQMRRAMGEAEKIAAQRAVDQNALTIRNHGLEPFRSQLIITDGNRPLIETDIPNSACVPLDWGVCPMSASACHIGGDPIIDSKVKSQYKPVEPGYLGQKNCPSCRFFVTGVPFLGGLVALTNEIALEIHSESGRFQNYTVEVNRLEAEWFDATQSGHQFSGESQRIRFIANQQMSASKLDSLLADYSAAAHYVQGCLKLINDDQSGEGGEGVRLITSGEAESLSVAFEESNSQYHLLAEICQNATIYQFANPSRALPLISQAIDRMAENNNLAPALFRLNDEQKLVVVNEFNRLLMMRLGSWERIESLFSGDLMLLDIDSHNPELISISEQVKNIFNQQQSLKVSHDD